MANEKIANMTNLADSGQDKFVENWTDFAKTMCYEQGVSYKFLNSKEGENFLAKYVTDTIEDGQLSTLAKDLLATLRVNHPHSEDIGGDSNV